MNFLIRIASLATASLAFNALAAEPNTSSRQVVALADALHARTAGSISSESLDEFAGRYETQDGIVSIIDHIGDSLVIELPEKLGSRFVDFACDKRARLRRGGGSDQRDVRDGLRFAGQRLVAVCADWPRARCCGQSCPARRRDPSRLEQCRHLRLPSSAVT